MPVRLVILLAFVAQLGALPRDTTAEESDFNWWDRSTCGIDRAQDADRCAKQVLMFGDRDFIIPETIEDVNNYCRRAQKNVICVKSYAKECLVAFSKQMFLTLFNGFVNGLRSICRTPRNRQRFFHYITCLNEDDLNQAHSCMDESVYRAEAIYKNLGGDDQIHAGCCTYQVTTECLGRALYGTCARNNKTGGEQRSQEATAFGLQLTKTLFGQLTDLSCGRKYNSIGNCIANDPNLMRQFAKWRVEWARLELGEDLTDQDGQNMTFSVGKNSASGANAEQTESLKETIQNQSVFMSMIKSAFKYHF